MITASGAADFSAKVWNAVDGEELLNLQHKHIVKSVNFSKDSVSLATASNDKLLRIFDLEKPEEPKLTFDGKISDFWYYISASMYWYWYSYL